MGSGSSKSKRRVIAGICCQQPLHPTEIPKGDSAIQGNVVCKQKERGQEKTANATQPGLETKVSRRPPNDPDLQLLDDMLTESEDCLSWQDPILKGQKMTNPSLSNAESLSPSQEDPRPDKEVPRLLRITPEVQPSPSEREQTKNIDDIYNKTVPVTRRILDTDNNNLSKQPHKCPVHMEAQSPIAYDDTEEALMDSIEHEYSQLHPVPATCCGKM